MATFANKHVGPVGFGLMGMTWRPQHTPDEQAFEAMKTALSLGASCWNSAEFYGQPDRTANLQLLNRYFTKYPEDADKVMLAVKGGVARNSMEPDSSPENTRASIDTIISYLGGKKKLDIYVIARIDKRYPIEETVALIDKEYIQTGKIGGVGISECSAETIKKAASSGVKISAVEIEYSLWSTEAEDIGVLAACKENGIPIFAYSPLGRGFLTGEFKSIDDIPEGDFRRFMPRFQPENFSKNLDLVRQVQQVAQKKGVTPAQLAIAWVRAKAEKLGVTVVPIPGATRADRVKENTTPASVSDEELANIEEILKSFTVAGGRYHPGHDHLLWA